MGAVAGSGRTSGGRKSRNRGRTDGWTRRGPVRMATHARGTRRSHRTGCTHVRSEPRRPRRFGTMPFRCTGTRPLSLVTSATACTKMATRQAIGSALT
eukprot:5384299-Prymnesium_polylepis.1